MAHFSPQHVRARADRILAQYLRPAIHRDREPVRLTAWEAPGEPVPFAHAHAQAFGEFDASRPWGLPWGTTWFRVQGRVPERWADVEGATPELIADIGFTQVQTGFQCEALAYDASGAVIKAVEPFNRYVTLPGGPDVEIYLEAASNPDVINEWSYVPTREGSPETMGRERLYTITEIALGLRDHDVAELVLDLETLLGLAHEVGDTSTRGTQILAAVARSLTALDVDRIADTAGAARDALREVLRAPANHGAHEVSAVGQDRKSVV